MSVPVERHTTDHSRVAFVSHLPWAEHSVQLSSVVKVDFWRVLRAILATTCTRSAAGVKELTNTIEIRKLLQRTLWMQCCVLQSTLASCLHSVTFDVHFLLNQHPELASSLHTKLHCTCANTLLVPATGMASTVGRASHFMFVLLTLHAVTAGSYDFVHDDLVLSLPWMQDIRQCACLLCMRVPVL